VIVRAAVVPHPPLLVPELVPGAVAATEPVRSACVAAASALAEVARDWIAVAADPAGPAELGPDRRGTFRGFGVDVPVSLSANATGVPDPALPLPALVAGWLRERAGADRVRVVLLEPGRLAADHRRIGAELARGIDPVGLLVLGDGSNRHGSSAPARPDERAADFDAAVAAALDGADPDALCALDPALAAELGVAGYPACQALAGAVAATRDGWVAHPGFHGAPFGVAYHVAIWEPRVR
jgi:hypothetical protein